ncbi:hypothetical protein NE237_007476 [Protea cynaroides]|uniref:U-box domain-containing protein n=1 Tax=Protea cynaroides TaxID=273540 RepID=A0A9Q0KPA2_9MAGN|nr:hypothetical protein NE237_007476 [Protea cynaroides]
MESGSEFPGNDSAVNSIRIPSIVQQTMEFIKSDDPNLKIQAAKEIRRYTKTSQKHRRHFSGAIEQLVAMLRSESPDCYEAALLAILNLAVKDEMNKIAIVNAGALQPLICFLNSNCSNLREYATAALLTLSASAINKPKISASGAIPLLLEILRDGSPQEKVDGLMALYNLSTHPENLSIILAAKAVSPLVHLLKICKKSSKTAEKCSALLESLLGFDEGRTALTSEAGGVLAVVEILECGSLQSREHAVGALLTMCESDRCRYREPILREGVIPGLLELTVQGTPKAQSKAQTLLDLLRDSPYQRAEFQADILENIVCDIISHIDGEDRGGKAQKMLAEMVKISREQSLKHLQHRASACTPKDRPLSNCTSEVSSK